MRYKRLNYDNDDHVDEIRHLLIVANNGPVVLLWTALFHPFVKLYINCNPYYSFIVLNFIHIISIIVITS